jgi:hypothetical protein
MREKSPYEGTYDRTGMVCLADVKAVNNQARSLTVKTRDDLHLYNVRVIHGMWHPGGDEQVSLPRVGTTGVVIFLGSEPYWIGASPIDMADGELQRANLEKIDAGDWIIKTIGKNKIIVRSAGTIEIQSTDMCRTFWIPSQNLINSVCQNFELETSGGSLKWRVDNKTEETNLRLKAWNSLTPDNGITLDIGTIPEINKEESSENIKPFDVSDLVLDFKQGTLDENLEFTPRSLRMSIKKDGSFYFDIGPGKFSLTVAAETGDVQFETKGNVTGLVKKDVNLTVEGKVTATVKKDMTLNADASVIANVKKDLTATVTGKASLNAKGGASIQTDGNAEVTAKGNITATASGDATVSANGKATLNGKGGTDVGSGAAPTNVNGAVVNLGGGGLPVARLSDQAIGIGNDSGPVVSMFISGSPKVTSG